MFIKNPVSLCTCPVAIHFADLRSFIITEHNDMRSQTQIIMNSRPIQHTQQNISFETIKIPNAYLIIMQRPSVEIPSSSA